METHSQSHTASGLHSTMLINNQEGIPNEHRSHIPVFLNEMDERGENSLLEKLHMPILHGGMEEVLLLASLTTSSAGSFAIACLALVLCVFLLELLKLLASWVENKYSCLGSAKTSACTCKQCNSFGSNVRVMTERKHYDAIHESSLPPADVPSISKSNSTRKWMLWIGIGGLQFLVHLFSTLLMLIAMTMNIYLIISMSSGYALGKMAVICLRKRLMNAH